MAGFQSCATGHLDARATVQFKQRSRSPFPAGMSQWYSTPKRACRHASGLACSICKILALYKNVQAPIVQAFMESGKAGVDFLPASATDVRLPVEDQVMYRFAEPPEVSSDQYHCMPSQSKHAAHLGAHT